MPTAMTRLRAFTLHLTGSVLIFLIFLGLMFFIWYPAPYFTIEVGWAALSILIGAGLALGPLLTLIVFKPGKRGLKFDMVCIVLMQLGAFLYGGFLIYQERPAFVVFGVDRFTAIPTSAIDVDQVPAELRQGSQPWLAQADFPEDPKVREDLMFAVLSGAPDIEYHPELYRPYAPDLLDLRKRSIDLPTLTARDADAKIAIDHFLARKSGRLADYLYLPLKGKKKDIVMVLSAHDGKPAGYIAISPWREDYR
ncbi:MAG: hypothetical protein KDJ31_06640 [Candidatus Competibacteraceae bacterium]|nr:hypothetical protein [Candidatus Competibacteraceae bacterium]HRY14360.1 hypothetical protein [Candidatus Competibacteraceae bacterium]